MSEWPEEEGRLPEDGESMTSWEYLRTPETLRVQELHYGVCRVARDSPTPRHQRLVFKLARALSAFVEPTRRGEIFFAPLDVILDETRGLIVQPDLFFVSAAQSHIVSDKVWGAPEVVVEVLSPSLRIGNRNDRVRWFAEYGVCELWLVHQLSNEIEVLQFAGGTIASQTRVGGHDHVPSRYFADFPQTLDDIAAS